MIIKRYLVSNMNEALTRIRHELGKEAVIIAQRKVRQPGVKGFFQAKLIEVTAAVENSVKEEKASKNIEEDDFKNSLDAIKKAMNKEIINKKIENASPIIEEDTKQDTKVLESENIKTDELEKEVHEMKKLLNVVIKNTQKEEEVDELLQLMNKLDIDLEFYNELKEEIGNSSNVLAKVRNILESKINICNSNLRGKVVLVGPTGVGKTTTIAKLAGNLSLVQKKKVGLITIDTYRIGAVEQLKTYAEIMGISFKVVITIKEMEEAVEELKDCDVILIDTTGRSSKNSMQISELRAFVQKANPDQCNLVLSAITKNKDIKTIIEGYKELQFDSVIVTKLDETTSYGVLYNIAKISNKPISFITTGQNVPDDIKIPNKEDLIKFIFEEDGLC